jgi:predicted ATP-binding protein involved in virulence
MSDTFISKIHIKEVRHIKDLEIPLSETEPKHLILTGKNGSGKTSVLEETAKSLLMRINSTLVNTIDLDSICIQFNADIKNKSSNYFIAFFEAKRNSDFRVPKGIEKLKTQIHPFKNRNYYSTEFVQYLVNLHADRAFAITDGDQETVEKIDAWFTNFEEQLGFLFDNKELKLKFDREQYNFNIIEKGKNPYSLHQLSDGYSAVLNIVTELMMSMELDSPFRFNFDGTGIVLIDELETHLHIDLQKRIFPFLTAFFPNIQFIISTHSPFVINSIDDAVVCDLEKRIIIDDNLSGYSSEAIVEGYFDSDKYSQQLKEKVATYEKLAQQKQLSKEEHQQLMNLEQYLDDIPKAFATELAVKIQQIKLKRLEAQSNK